MSDHLQTDGPPTTFLDAEDTGIPSLRRWRQELTVQPWERAARKYLEEVAMLAHSIQSYLEDIGEVTENDWRALRAPRHSSFPRSYTPYAT